MLLGGCASGKRQPDKAHSSADKAPARQMVFHGGRIWICGLGDGHRRAERDAVMDRARVEPEARSESGGPMRVRRRGRQQGALRRAARQRVSLVGKELLRVSGEIPI